MKRSSNVLGAAAALTVLALALRPSPAQELASWAPPVFEASGRFADALSRKDATACQAATTPQLWTRLAPKVAAGTYGSVEVLQSGNLVRPGVAYVHLLCTHQDGVSDVVTITLRQLGNEWKVAGGPCGMTPP